MSRFCIFLLGFFTHLSFKSGEFIKDRRSPPVFQHPKPRQRVTTLRPKSIYGRSPGKAATAQTKPLLLADTAAHVALFSSPLEEETGCSLHQTVYSSSKENQYFSLSFLTNHYPRDKLLTRLCCLFPHSDSSL